MAVMDPSTIMMLAQFAKGATKTIGQTIGGVAGGIQMLVGYNQLRKAQKLPFPDYTSGMQYANENMEMYRKQYQEGLGDDTLGGVRKESSGQTAKTLRTLAETTPQFAGQAASRIGALDRLSTEVNLSKLDEAYRRSAISGMTRSAAEISTIQQRDITAKREYKMMAQQAAGEAIATGSENLVQGIQYMLK
jgi:hypothetical protein